MMFSDQNKDFKISDKDYKISFNQSFYKTIKIRKIQSQNIVHRLYGRETHRIKPGANINSNNLFYTNIFPNFTVSGVEKPPCFLRKFTPNGKYLIAFSADQSSLEIYQFIGSQAAESLLENINGDYLTKNTDHSSNAICMKLFQKFFKLLHSTKIIDLAGSEVLNRECSLFTEDSRFVIVGSSHFLAEEGYPHYRILYENNETLSPQDNQLEEFSIHVVEVASGILFDTIKFKCDKIYLSHNQGVYLFNRTLAVLSVHQQTIHIFQLTEQGKLVKCRSIGRFCHEFDHSRPSSEEYFLFGKGFWGRKEIFICTMKQKLLIFLFKLAYSQFETTGKRTALLQFHHNFDFLLRLKMWRMQMLDESLFLIRYSTEEIVKMTKSPDPNLQPSFFGIYDYKEAKFLAFYENNSLDLVFLFENYMDVFRNSYHNNQASQKIRQTISNVKSCNKSEMIRRFLALLPISAQSFSSSPYLDLTFYSYDENWVSDLERPKSSGDHAIRFFAKDSGSLKFKIFTGLVGVKNSSVLSARRLVAFIFHPSEPFAISVQRTNSEYVVNFHIRHQTYNQAGEGFKSSRQFIVKPLNFQTAFLNFKSSHIFPTSRIFRDQEEGRGKGET